MSEKTGKKQELTKEEQIGFHKGALSTLAGEQQELFKMLQITESLIKHHVKSLEDLGIKFELKENKK